MYLPGIQSSFCGILAGAGGDIVKEKDKQPIIVPYAYNVDGTILGNPAANLSGLPVYVGELTENEGEEDLLE